MKWIQDEQPMKFTKIIAATASLTSLAALATVPALAEVRLHGAAALQA